MDFDGDCVTLNHSETSLKSLDFMKKARSAKIEGTCPWLVCTKENFKGHRVRLNPNTDYEILPHDLHRKIASLRDQSFTTLMADLRQDINRVC